MNDELEQYKVVVHEKAGQMLYAHVRFLANVSISAARRLRTMLYESLSSLEIMPQRCPIYRTRRTSDIYHQLVVGRYIVIFSIDEQKKMVTVQYILDSRQENDI
ncbi:MAG: type II toxin-antitoxin system RelE/ParE family toxin [Firmicutes bacterium]|nr:type II toxin-antitoxin system RelE/ParE family toxin [Bacillota bacterium]